MIVLRFRIYASLITLCASIILPRCAAISLKSQVDPQIQTSQTVEALNVNKSINQSEKLFVPVASTEIEQFLFDARNWRQNKIWRQTHAHRGSTELAEHFLRITPANMATANFVAATSMGEGCALNGTAVAAVDRPITCHVLSFRKLQLVADCREK